MYHAWVIIKELKEVRQIRRKAKDEIYVLDTVENFRISQEKKCENVLTGINLTLKSMANRKYANRINYKFTNINV